MFMCLAICATCACYLVICREESLFVDAIRLPIGQTAVFHLNIGTKQVLHLLVSWKSVRYLNMLNARPSRVERISLRVHILVSGRFCVCLTQICTGRIWVALWSRATTRPLFGVHDNFFHEKWNILWRNSKISSFWHFLFYVVIIMGAIWWWTRRTCPHAFSNGAYIICHVSHFFSLGFVFGEASKWKWRLSRFVWRAFHVG